MIAPALGETGFDWAQRFDERVRDDDERAAEDLLSLPDDPDYDLAVPTRSLPAAALPGGHAVGAAWERRQNVVVDGYAFGSLSMTSYVVS
jgi:4,5-DOPA dioxygenase extradiol